MNNHSNTSDSYLAAVDRFCRQPIGRSHLVVRDHVRSALNNAALRRVNLSTYAFDLEEVEHLLRVEDGLTLRRLAAHFAAYRPNAADTIHMVRRARSN